MIRRILIFALFVLASFVFFFTPIGQKSPVGQPFVRDGVANDNGNKDYSGVNEPDAMDDHFPDGNHRNSYDEVQDKGNGKPVAVCSNGQFWLVPQNEVDNGFVDTNDCGVVELCVNSEWVSEIEYHINAGVVMDTGDCEEPPMPDPCDPPNEEFADSKSISLRCRE